MFAVFEADNFYSEILLTIDIFTASNFTQWTLTKIALFIKLNKRLVVVLLAYTAADLIFN